MIDALLYAVRDGIRAANIGYGTAECELMDDGRPPPRCGNVFAAVHGGRARSTSDNTLNELYEFAVTLTMRVVVPLDRVGTQQIARNVVLETARRQGFDAKLEQLRGLLHMNWGLVVLTGQVPNSANDNLATWATGREVYGFSEPMRYRGYDMAKLVSGEWFGADPEADDIGVASEMHFDGARRFQPVTSQSGPFV